MDDMVNKIGELIQLLTRTKEPEQLRNIYEKLLMLSSIKVENIDYNNVSTTRLINIMLDNANQTTDEIKIAILINLVKKQYSTGINKILPLINDRDRLVEVLLDYNDLDFSDLPEEIVKSVDVKIKELEKRKHDEEILEQLKLEKFEKDGLNYGIFNLIRELNYQENILKALKNNILPYLNTNPENELEFNCLNDHLLSIATLFTYLKNIDNEQKMDIMRKIFQDIDNLERIKNNNNYETWFDGKGLKVKFIDTINDYKFAYQVLEKENLLNDFFNRSISLNNGTKITKENIDEILKRNGVKDVEKQKQYINEMEKEDDEIYGKVNVNMLTDEYFEIFTPHELAVFFNCMGIRREFTRNELVIIKYVLQKDSFENIDDIYLKGYSNLIENIDFDSLQDEEKIKIIRLLNYPNIINIQTMDDVNNFDKILEEKAQDEYDLKKLKNYICLKAIGMDYESARELYINFKTLSKSEKQLQEVSNILDKIGEIPDWNIGSYKEFRNLFISIPRKNVLNDLIKTKKENYKYIHIFEEEFNNVLYKPMEVVEEKDGIKIYDAGTNFHILMTAKSPYSHETVDYRNPNYAKDWNRNKLVSSVLCASFISNEMFGMVKSPENVYYGFSEIKNGALRRMGKTDIQSSSVGTNDRSETPSKFYHPDELINNTGYEAFARTDLYNEVDIKRHTNEEKLQPSFIMSFIVNGELINEYKALEISKQFLELGIDVPIVRINVDACLKKGIEEINDLTKQYKENRNFETLKQIWIKFHNNMVTYNNFIFRYKRINFQDIVDLPDEIKRNLYHPHFFNTNMFEIEKPTSEAIYGLDYNLELLQEIFNKEMNNSQLNNNEQINELKQQIAEYDKQIALLLSNMQLSNINEEISKLIEKNNEINSSQIIDSLQDYKKVIEIKEILVSYLKQEVMGSQLKISEQQMNDDVHMKL